MRRFVVALGTFLLCASFTTAHGDGSGEQALKRETLNEKAQALLERADALQRERKYAGAFDAYMEAVRLDRRAGDLALIDSYGNLYDVPLPPNASEADKKLADQQAAETLAGRQAALRQYLQLHRGDEVATERLAAVVKPAETELLLAPLFKAHPADPELHSTRAVIRMKQGNYTGAFEDAVKAAELDAKKAERHYVAGVVGYEGVMKGNLAPPAKRDLIGRAIDQLRAAEAMQKVYFEAMTYHSLLLRQQASMEKDSAVREKLAAEAEALHQKAVDIIKAQRERALEQHPQ